MPGQGKRIPEPTKVETPVFRTAQGALAWAEGQLTRADAKGAGTFEDLLPTLAAYMKASGLPGASDSVRVEATIKQAEIFLRLSAPENALDTMGSLPHDIANASGRMTEIHERTAEAAEMLNHKDSPLSTYRLAVDSAKTPEWKALALYRAGLVASNTGRDQLAATLLEEAIESLPDDTTEGILSRSVLARTYLATDRARAQAWSSAAKAAIGRAGRKSVLPRTFISQPTAAQVATFVDETERLVRSKRS